MNMILFSKTFVELILVFICSIDQIGSNANIENSMWFTRQNVNTRIFSHIHFVIPDGRNALNGISSRSSKERTRCGISDSDYKIPPRARKPCLPSNKLAWLE